MSQDKVDIILRNSRIIDPANEVDFIGDIAVKDGKIYRIGSRLEIASSDDVDFSGCIVTPGLIDIHVHGYEFATPLGVNVDRYCLARGSTTVVDAGSAGSATFAGLRKFIAEKSRTRVLAFLHIAEHGLAAATLAASGGGECDALNRVSVESCRNCINANRDLIVGVKVRLSASVASDGKHEKEIYKRALEVSEKCNLPLMAHHALSTIQTGENRSDDLTCPGNLRPGDIYTHTYHPWESTIIDKTTGKIIPQVIEARRRGVLFDLGHGHGSFSWTVAERCAAEGFWPDFIGTDIHSFNTMGPVYDLTVVMSKMLHVGMTLDDVIKATTVNPAKAIGRDDVIGTLGIGRTADITVMRMEPVDADVEDCVGQTRRMKTRITPVAVWKDGEQFDVTQPLVFPNKKACDDLRKTWQQAEIKDEIFPTSNCC